MDLATILFENIEISVRYLFFTLIPAFFSNPTGQINSLITWLINGSMWVKFLVLSSLLVIGRTVVFGLNEPVLMIIKVLLLTVFSISIYHLCGLIM